MKSDRTQWCQNQLNVQKFYLRFQSQKFNFTFQVAIKNLFFEQNQDFCRNVYWRGEQVTGCLVLPRANLPWITFFLAQMMGATFFPFFFSTFLISRKFVDMNENKTCFLFWPTLFIENLAIRVGFTALLIDHQQCWKSLMTARVI